MVVLINAVIKVIALEVNTQLIHHQTYGHVNVKMDGEVETVHLSKRLIALMKLIMIMVSHSFITVIKLRINYKIH